MSPPLRLLARTARGVEWVAAAELRGALGANVQTVGHRELQFTLDVLSPDVVRLGTVDDVYVVVGSTKAFGHTRAELPRIGAAATQLAIQEARAQLRAIREVPARPRFDVTATFLGKRNFNRFEIEDVVGEALAGLTGWRYESRREGAPPPTQLTVRVHLSNDSTVFAVRIAEAPLHRRAYRQHSRTASLRPPIGRVLALLAGLRAGARLLDPFCGAGTIPIEAMLATAEVQAFGSDVDAAVIPLARQNAQAAGTATTFRLANAATLAEEDASFQCLATNPPWGEGVKMIGSFAAAWTEVRRVLSDDARIAAIGPPELLDECERRLDIPCVLAQPLRVLGAMVEIRVLARSEMFAGLLGSELAHAWERYAA
jgi:tRNA (guanine6-N2)-methyltransferase